MPSTVIISQTIREVGFGGSKSRHPCYGYVAFKRNKRERERCERETRKALARVSLSKGVVEGM